MRKSKFGMPVTVILIAIIVGIGMSAFTNKATTSATKKALTATTYVYIGDATPSQQRDPSNYVLPSLDNPLPDECGGNEMICTIVTPTNEGPHPTSFTTGSNPFDQPSNFSAQKKDDLSK